MNWLPFAQLDDVGPADGRELVQPGLAVHDEGALVAQRLERARDEIRRLKAGFRLEPGGVTVEVLGGLYERTTTFELGPDDSGTQAAVAVRSLNPSSVDASLGAVGARTAPTVSRVFQLRVVAGTPKRPSTLPR